MDAKPLALHEADRVFLHLLPLQSLQTHRPRRQGPRWAGLVGLAALVARAARSYFDLSQKTCSDT